MSEQRPGIGVDAKGNSTVDPTKNVLDLVEAAVRRTDDLSTAEIRRRDDLAAAELRRHDDLRDAEKERNNELRALDSARQIEIRHLHQTMDESIHRFQEQLGAMRIEAVNATVLGQKEIISMLKESTSIAVDRAASARESISATLHDTVSRAEHDRLVSELAAYKLEVSQTVAAKQAAFAAATQGAHESRTELRGNVSSFSTVLVALAAAGGFVLANFVHTPAPAPQVVYVPGQQSAPPVAVLVPPTVTPTK